jgi:(R,R)-butanediol dehydrogenase / meso-butanediol dehydrogenase / diacetyl reductase
MKAAVYHGRRDLRVETVPDPEPGPDDLIIRVGACGICGTDLEEYTVGPLFIPKDEPHPLTGRTLPMIMGHEFAGEVVDVGKNVTRFRPGDRIGPDVLITCGECYWCQRHQVATCPNQGALGLADDGGLAEYCRVPEFMCIQLPNGMPWEAAAIAEPVSVAVRAVRRGRVTVGEKVAIFGGGTIGLLTLQMARVAGASEVYVIEPLANRRDLAESLGATATLDPREADPVEWLRERTRIGPDVTIEAAGAPVAAPTAIDAVRPGGRVVLVGIPTGSVEFDFLRVVVGEKEVLGSISHVYDEDYQNAIWLLGEGRIDYEPLISRRIPLDDVVTGGFDWLLEHQADTLKIIVEPGG